MTRITVDQAYALVDATRGRIFGAEFRKRTDGSTRRMACRTGVSIGVTGRGRSYDPMDHGLAGVYDVRTRGHRHVPLVPGTRLRYRGEDYVVVSGGEE